MIQQEAGISGNFKFHGNPLNLQVSMNFRGCRTKPGPKCSPKTSAARFVRPLRGAEVLVAVRGPSPGDGGEGKKKIALSKSVAEAASALWSKHINKSRGSVCEENVEGEILRREEIWTALNQSKIDWWRIPWRYRVYRLLVSDSSTR